MPEVSIIIPVYNVQEHIGGCLDALTAQTLKEIEIICVDDGSVDNSAEIIDEYASRDSRVRVIHQKNAGVSAARNAGLDCANAPLVMFCDSDDEYAPEMVESLCRTMRRFRCDFARCGVDVINSTKHSNIGESCFSLPFGEGEILLSDDSALLMDSVVWNKIFRKDIIDRYGVRFPEGLRYEDTCFFWKYVIVSKSAVLINAKLYRYWLREGSFTSLSGTSRLLDYIRNMDNLFDFIEKNCLWAAKGSLFLKIFVRTFDLVYQAIPRNDRDKCYNLALPILQKIGESQIRDMACGEYYRALTCILRRKYLYSGTSYLKICGVKVVKFVRKLGRREIRVFGVPVYRKKYKMETVC